MWLIMWKIVIAAAAAIIALHYAAEAVNWAREAYAEIHPPARVETRPDVSNPPDEI